MENLALDGLSLSAFPSAKIKIDELFVKWLASNEGYHMVSALLQEVETAEGLQVDREGIPLGVVADTDISKVNTLGNLKSSIGAAFSGPGNGLSFSSVSAGFNSPFGQVGAAPHALGEAAPPRSPTKKSPKKRTQSEMYTSSGTSPGRVGSPGGFAGGSLVSFEPAFDSLKSGSPGTSKGRASVATSEASPSAASGSISGAISIAESVDGVDSEGTAHVNARRRANFDTIPVFYRPRGQEKAEDGGVEFITRAGRGSGPARSLQQKHEDSLASRLAEIEEFFSVYPAGVPQDKLVHATKRLMGLPSYFNVPIVERIHLLYGDAAHGSNSHALWPDRGAKVQLEAFKKYWELEVAPYDRVERFFRAIAQPGKDYIVKDDFLPFLRELLHFHPGLDFLESHEDFQQKYALTVIARIFYEVNTSGTGRLSLKEVYRSNLFNAFMHVDEQNDINRVREYFSYEHFYVLYCRFFELDTDHDLHLSPDDLLRYSDYALSDAIVERIFSTASRAFTDGCEGGLRRGGMPYEDFVFFMLAEEDKTTEQSIRYWFKCCDLDGDGILTPEEMHSFYRVQLHRAVSWGQEAIEFGDVLCQLVDLIDPVDPRAITVADLLKADKRSLTGILFDALFNVQKFLKFETRDPFQEKMKREDGFASEWDRFAAIEYSRLADADGGRQSDASVSYDGGMEVDSPHMGGGAAYDPGLEYDGPEPYGGSVGGFLSEEEVYEQGGEGEGAGGSHGGGQVQVHGASGVRKATRGSGSRRGGHGQGGNRNRSGYGGGSRGGRARK